MKRIAILLLILMLTLCACSTESAQIAETSAAAESAPIAETTAAAEPSGVVQVSTVDEFLAAIVPGNTIELAPGEYRLEEASDYGNSQSRYYTWNDLGLGDYGLQIQYVNGLTIRGAGKDATNLTTQNRSVNVLNLVDCNDITISDMTLGHTKMTEACEGGVIYLNNAKNTALQGLGLYGCGTLGVIAFECESLAVDACEIYDCSIGGVQISDCRQVNITDSTFRNLGKDSPVMHVFSIYGSPDVLVSGCRITDNYVDHLIWADWGVTFRDNQFTANRVSQCAFYLAGEGVVLQDNIFEDNELRNWYSPSGSLAIDEQGNPVEMESPVAERVEVTPGVATPVSTGEQKEVRVHNVDDFLKAIDSDTCIILSGKLFDLSQSQSYQEAAKAMEEDVAQMKPYYDKDNPNYYWQNNFDGPSLVISGVSNLTIKAEGSDRTATTISATPRYADVLSFENCSAVTLEGFTAGHTKEPGYCSGGVLNFNTCTDVLIDNCGMYGCGTVGVNASYTQNLQVVNSEIYECSYNGISLWNSENVAISGTIIRDIRNEWEGEAPHFNFSGCRNVTLDGVPLNGYYIGN